MGLGAMLTRSNPSALQCDQCPKTFHRNRKADLVRHMRVHTNEKPYICHRPGCEKTFKQSSALKNHQNFHDRDRKLDCGHCNATFYDKPTLNRHVREKHELSEVFKCPVYDCGKCFKRKNVLRAHIEQKHQNLDPTADLRACRVSAAGNYGPMSGLFVRNPEQIAARTNMPCPNVSVPGLTMGSMTEFTSSYLASPYNMPAQVYSDAVQLNHPYNDHNARGLMPPPINYGLDMGYQPAVCSLPDPYDNIDPSLLYDELFFAMLAGSGSQKPAPRAAFTGGLVPSVQVSAATPVPTRPLSPSRGISPSVLMHQQLQQPSVTSPQPSLVFSSPTSGYSSPSDSPRDSPSHSRPRSGTTSPVIAGSASISRRQSPTYR